MSIFYIQSVANSDLVIDIKGGASEPTDPTQLDAYTLWQPYHKNQEWTWVPVDEHDPKARFWIQSVLCDPDGDKLVISIAGIDPQAKGNGLVVSKLLKGAARDFQTWKFTSADNPTNPNAVLIESLASDSSGHALYVNIAGDEDVTSKTPLDVWTNDGKLRQQWQTVLID